MNDTHRRRSRGGLCALLAATFLLAACGGPASASPTAIPADVARPNQPTPSYSTAVPRAQVRIPTREPVFITPPASAPAPLAEQPQPLSRVALLAAYLMEQPPSAMGIATGGATVLDAPGGSLVASAPAGSSLTVTGRSADGAWLAVFTDDAVAGWVPAGTLLLFGDDDLTVVDKSVSPAPVATLLAEAMTPVSTPLALLVQRTPPTGAEDTSVAGAGNAGSDVAVGRIAIGGNANLRANLRANPSTDATVLASLAPGSDLVVTGRSEDGAWLQVRTPAGDGWVAASLVMFGDR